MDIGPSPFTRPKREEQRRLKREAVLRTAASLFSQNGYAATQMSDIARQLGVTKPTIYKYFGHKDEILATCFETGYDWLQNAMQEPSGARTGAERLKVALCRYGELITKDFGRTTVRVSPDELSDAGRKRTNAARRKFDCQIRAMVADAIADGSLAPCDPKIVTFTALGSLNWIGIWFKADGELDARQASRAIVEQLFAGLATPAASGKDADGSIVPAGKVI